MQGPIPPHSVMEWDFFLGMLIVLLMDRSTRLYASPISVVA